jgi:hypothetical protein
VIWRWGGSGGEGERRKWRWRESGGPSSPCLHCRERLVDLLVFTKVSGRNFQRKRPVLGWCLVVTCEEGNLWKENVRVSLSVFMVFFFFFNV